MRAFIEGLSQCIEIHRARSFVVENTFLSDFVERSTIRERHVRDRDNWPLCQACSDNITLITRKKGVPLPDTHGSDDNWRWSGKCLLPRPWCLFGCFSLVSDLALGQS